MHEQRSRQPSRLKRSMASLLQRGPAASELSRSTSQIGFGCPKAYVALVVLTTVFLDTLQASPMHGMRFDCCDGRTKRSNSDHVLMIKLLATSLSVPLPRRLKAFVLTKSISPKQSDAIVEMCRVAISF